MSGKASERQARFARHLNDMAFGDRVNITVGKYPKEDVPVATVRISTLPEFDFLVPKIKEALTRIQKEVKQAEK